LALTNGRFPFATIRSVKMTAFHFPSLLIAGGWTSLKEAEVSSGFFPGSFWVRCVPSSSTAQAVIFRSMTRAAQWIDCGSLSGSIASVLLIPIAPRNISSWILLLRVRSHPTVSVGT
jgi:hypothetical protein